MALTHRCIRLTFPELTRFFSTYFHQDWNREAGNAADILARFFALSYTKSAKLQRLATEIRQLIDKHGDDAGIEAALDALRCSYEPSADGRPACAWLEVRKQSVGNRRTRSLGARVAGGPLRTDATGSGGDPAPVIAQADACRAEVRRLGGAAVITPPMVTAPCHTVVRQAQLLAQADGRRGERTHWERHLRLLWIEEGE